MKALIQHAYGPLANALRVDEIPTSEPGPDEVRVRVAFAALNPLDWKIVDGKFRWVVKARPPCGVGFELSGHIDACGTQAKRFAPGARVTAALPAGSFQPRAVAQYALVPQALLASLPDSVALDQASALPVVGMSALQMLRLAAVGAGQRVLVNGAAGGVGHLAVQLAAMAGAKVTGTARTFNHELVSGLGAERVVDPRSSPPANWGGPFDVVIDCASTLNSGDITTLMPRAGRYVSSLPRVPRFLADPLINTMSRRKRYTLMLKGSVEDLEYLIREAAAGHLRVEVSRVYSLDLSIEALSRLREGGVAGKIVVDTR